MAKGYLSNRQKNLKVGITSYTENNTVVEVIGNVGIGTTNATSKLYVVGDTYITGILTANRIISNVYGEFTGGSISGNNIVGTALSISGISTLGAVQISSGIITATSGIVTYYGDGTNLTGLIPNTVQNTTSSSTHYPLLSPSTSGTISSLAVSSTNIVFIPSSGRLGIGSTIPTVSLDVIGNSRISGVVTATTFSGSLSGTATTATNLEDAANITTGTINSSRLSGSYGISITGNAATSGYATTAGIATVAQGLTGTPNITVGIATVNTELDVGVGATIFTALPSGNIGVGTTNPSRRLHVQGELRLTAGLYDFNNVVGAAGSVLTSTGAGVSWSASTGGITISDDTTTNAIRYPIFDDVTSGSSSAMNVSSTKLQFNPSTGTLSATVFTSLSDKSQKTNIKQIQNPIEITKQLRGVKFKWKDNHHNSLGLIAQEVEKVLPEVVNTDENGIKSVNYGSLIGLLIETIKEQQIRIEKLEDKLNA